MRSTPPPGGPSIDAEALGQAFSPFGFSVVLIRLDLNLHRYSTAFATQLARSIRGLCKPSDRVAFLCSPTAFVAFQHEYSWKKAHLLEFDSRFSVLDPKRFIHYDLDEPYVLPEGLTGTVDIAVVDPPFLNEVCYSVSLIARRSLYSIRPCLGHEQEISNYPATDPQS